MNLSYSCCEHIAGGNVVLLYASKYHDIGAVVNLSGRYDLKKGIKERLGDNFLERIKKDGYIDVKNRAGSLLYFFISTISHLMLYFLFISSIAMWLLVVPCSANSSIYSDLKYNARLLIC